jgi:hypothetical protein
MPGSAAEAACGRREQRSLSDLHDVHAGQSAIVIMGGPSLLRSGIHLGALRAAGLVTFVETKALTPRLLASGLDPDYVLMLFPEKSKDNSVQHVTFNGMLAGFDVAPLLRAPFQPMARLFQRERDTYLQPGNVQRGPHKRYRWRPDVYLPDSPFDLLRAIPRARLVANGRLWSQHFPTTRVSNPLYTYEHESTGTFDLARYFHPEEQDGQVVLAYNAFLNSAAIALYPVLHYLGFARVYLLGMDMSMLGSMEYAAPFTFKSMVHYFAFFVRALRTFNANFRPNWPFYLRPTSEFEDLRTVFGNPYLPLVRVYAPDRYAAAVPGIPSISPSAFTRLVTEEAAHA